MTKAELRAECTELYEYGEGLEVALDQLLNIMAHHLPKAELVAILGEWAVLGGAVE